MIRTTLGLLLTLALAAGSSLTANAQYYGGNGYNAPNGSYQQSCTNIRMRGATLSAACTAGNGQQRWSSINVSGCNGDIANNNGYLQCNGNNGYGNNGNNGWHHHHHQNWNGNNGYGNNGYGNNGYGYQVPSGSYQSSCNNARMQGSVLTASCNSGHGWNQTTINAARCSERGSDIRNDNGFLRC